MTSAPQGGAPPGKRSGPPLATEDRLNATAGQTVTTDRVAARTDAPPELRELVEQAAALVDDIGDQAARDEENYQRGYRDAARIFFDHGVDVGRAQAEREMAEEWRRLAEGVRGHASMPTHAELEARRYPGYTPERLRELRRRGAA